jgi:hypothetical protein
MHDKREEISDKLGEVGQDFGYLMLGCMGTALGITIIILIATAITIGLSY